MPKKVRECEWTSVDLDKIANIGAPPDKCNNRRREFGTSVPRGGGEPSIYFRYKLSERR